MYTPALEEIEQLSGQGNLAPIFREINADVETPVSAYLKISRPPYSFLLESVEGSEQVARYSFIGTDPVKVIRTGSNEPDGAIDPLMAVEGLLADYTVVPTTYMQRFSGGAVGYLAYEAANYFECLPSPQKDTLKLPEALFMLTTTFVEFDHVRHKMRVVSHVNLDTNDLAKEYSNAVCRIENIIQRLSSPLTENQSQEFTSTESPVKISSNMSKGKYSDMIDQAKANIVAGEVIQVVLSQRLAYHTEAHPFEIYRTLRTINPSPYMYYLNFDDFQIAGASPEMLVQVEGRTVSTRPIAGTRPRGRTEEEDQRLENELKTDEKERAEHIMLLDLGRNDIGRVSKPGTVKVTEIMDVERYSHVMHLVSHVTGELEDAYSNFDALRACFPAGTVSGAPKVRAMELISDLEPEKRGPYSGAVGYFDFKGNMDTAITIRTLVMKNKIAYAQAGGGIVFDSQVENEYQETLHKASAVIRAIEETEKDNLKNSD